MPERTRSRRAMGSPAALAFVGSVLSLIACGSSAKGCDCRFATDTLRPLMKNIVILISGRGSNMEAIVRRSAEEAWPARVAAVVSNRADAAGLAFAEAR